MKIIMFNYMCETSQYIFSVLKAIIKIVIRRICAEVDFASTFNLNFPT